MGHLKNFFLKLLYLTCLAKSRLLGARGNKLWVRKTVFSGSNDCGSLTGFFGRWVAKMSQALVNRLHPPAGQRWSWLPEAHSAASPGDGPAVPDHRDEVMAMMSIISKKIIRGETVT
jgi:hypothetical protein